MIPFSDGLSRKIEATDIIPGTYEGISFIAKYHQGGLKNWECSEDLRKFLVENIKDLGRKQVLEVLIGIFTSLQLGCGLGECGSICAPMGGKVLLQDYNQEVLDILRERLTSSLGPSIIHNISFYRGSWDDLLAIISEEQFDLILGSEILYNEDNYESIISILSKSLKKNREALIATKNMYFGLSGSAHSFEDALKKENFTIVRVPTHKVGIARSILVIKKI